VEERASDKGGLGTERGGHLFGDKKEKEKRGKTPVKGKKVDVIELSN